MKIALVFLTKNEITGLRAIFNRVGRDIFDEVFVVDGGSKDGTLEFFKEKGVRVLSQTSPGRGEAFRLAFGDSKSDAIVFFSPDGNEDPADLPKFQAYLEKGFDMVIASRMMKGAFNEEDTETLRFRKWANLAFGALANLFWNRSTWVSDTINGYRAITRSCFDALKPDAKGFTIEYQMSIRAMKKNTRIAEFPTREGFRLGGTTGAKSIPTGWVFFKLLAREVCLGKNF